MIELLSKHTQCKSCQLAKHKASDSSLVVKSIVKYPCLSGYHILVTNPVNSFFFKEKQQCNYLFKKPLWLMYQLKQQNSCFIKRYKTCGECTGMGESQHLHSHSTDDLFGSWLFLMGSPGISAQIKPWANLTAFLILTTAIKPV